MLDLTKLREILPIMLDTQSMSRIYRVRYMYNPYNSELQKFHEKYKFGRAKWYYCKYKFGTLAQVLDWCTEQYGELSHNGDAWMRWKPMGTSIRFLHEDDAVAFKLRWGEE